jgi:phage baseplate assembly protein W
MVKGSKGPFKTNDTTLEAVKSNLTILILSNYGERCIQYDFGANLRELLFEPNTDTLKDEITDRITRAVSVWMNFVKINDINVSTLSNYPNAVTVNMKFSIGQLTDELTVTVRS